MRTSQLSRGQRRSRVADVRSIVLVAALSAPMFPRGVHRRERTARPVVDAGALVFRRGRVARPMRRLRQCRHGSPSAPVRWLRCLTVACCRKPTLESGRPRPSFLSDGGIESVGRPFPGVDHVGRRGGRRLDASTRGIRRSLRYRMRRRVGVGRAPGWVNQSSWQKVPGSRRGRCRAGARYC